MFLRVGLSSLRGNFPFFKQTPRLASFPSYLSHLVTLMNGCLQNTHPGRKAARPEAVST